MLRILPWALVVHCAVSVWSYGADTILGGVVSDNMTLPAVYYSKLSSISQ